MTLPNAKAQPVAERWWIATDELSRGGKKLMGPFQSRDLALHVRSLYEQVYGGTYWVAEESE